jgi:hypothetical protein
MAMARSSRFPWALPGRLAIAVAVAGCTPIEPPTPAAPGHGLIGDGPHRLVVGAGVFDAFDEAKPSANIDGDRTAAIQVDVRGGSKLYGIGPATGVMVNHNGGTYAFGGLYADIAIGPYIVITPLVGSGAYFRNNSKDMGGPFAVRTELAIGAVRDDGIGVGFRWGHLSNAYIYSDNPSQEDFMITLSVAF